MTVEGPAPNQASADNPEHHQQPRQQLFKPVPAIESLKFCVRRSFRQCILVLLMDNCPIMFSSYVTEFYAARSVCTMSVYVYHLQLAGCNLVEITLCVSCTRRELLSTVHPATIATAASSSQLAKPAAAKKDSCGGEESLTVEEPDLAFMTPPTATGTAYKTSFPGGRWMCSLTCRRGRARRQTIVCT